MKLSYEQIEREMRIIADSGMEEILILTGESRAKSSVEYIGEACKLARKYFRMVGVEVYPVNVDEYRYLHECGVDYVTVFQETYDKVRFEQLHLMGHKRVFPYRFESQERALMAGMRGVAFSALLGLSDFRRDALASALHVYYLQKKYPHAEMSLSCPRLRPIINNDKIDPLDVREKELCQVLCAYRIFLPYVGITVSSRESKEFRNGIVKIAATKVSAGVSTGIGDHESKYSGHDDGEGGDEQFEINKECWGGFGELFGKKVAFCLIDTQKTMGNLLMTQSDNYTISFYTSNNTQPSVVIRCKKLMAQTIDGKEAQKMSPSCIVGKSYNMYVGEILK